MNHLAWRATSIIEFKTLKLASSLIQKKREGHSIGSMNFLASHRGAFSKELVGNSEKSIILASQKGFRYIELDVNFSKEHVPIIFHDTSLKRLTNVNRRTSDVSWDEIKQLKLRDGQKILRLRQFLSEYAQLFDAIILDIKGGNNFVKERATSFVNVVSKSKFSKEIYVIGLNCSFLSKIKSMDPRFKIGCEDQGIFYNYFNGNNLISLNYNTQFSYLEYCIANRFDMTLILWTINNKQNLEKLRHLKNSIILTDLHNVN